MCHRVLISCALAGLIAIFAITACSKKQAQIELIERYQAAANSHRVDSLMAFYSDDISADIVGMGATLSGKDALRGLAEYDSVLNTKRYFTVAGTHKDSVFCQGRESNDWLNIIGIPSVAYSNALFLVKKGKIYGLMVNLSDSSVASINDIMGQLIPWAQENRPDELSRIASDSGFVYSAQSAEAIKRLTEEWRFTAARQTH